MIKNNKGVTLMTLVITIVTMVILISIVGYFSIESINNSHISNEKKEMADVLEYVLVRKAKLLNKEFDLKEKYGDVSGDIVNTPIVTEELLGLVARNLNETWKNNIIEVNQNNVFPDEYKYIYITADKLNNEALSKEYTVIRDVKNNYIINFYTGTVIGLYDNGERIEASGIIKGIAEIESTLY